MNVVGTRGSPQSYGKPISPPSYSDHLQKFVEDHVSLQCSQASVSAGETHAFENFKMVANSHYLVIVLDDLVPGVANFWACPRCYLSRASITTAIIKPMLTSDYSN